MIVFGNRVLCLVVLFLLQSAGWMGMAQGEPLISVRITNHIYLTAGENSAPHVTYDFSKEICEKRGAYVLSGYTKAIRTEVMNKVYSFGHGENIIFYIGADMEYSVHDEPDSSKKCDYSVRSLNCIYKWNQGIWANALGDGSGVGFFKGNDPEVQGADNINGYDVTLINFYRSTSRTYLIRFKYHGDSFVFLIHSFSSSNEGYPKQKSMAICELQDGTIIRVETTTTTTNTSQSAGSEVSGAPDESDNQSGWPSGLTAVMVVLPILLLILVVVLCLYCCGCICRRKADGHRVTENSIATTHIDGEESVMRRKTENPNMGTTAGNEMNPLLRNDRQDRREKIRITWGETPQKANVLVRSDSAVPSDLDAAPGQLSRRRSSILSSRLDRWRSMRRTGVVVPIGEVIAEDTIGE